MLAPKPYALGEHPDGFTRSWLDKPVAFAPDLRGRAALDSLPHETPGYMKYASLARQYPAQAAYLSLCVERGYGEARIRQGILKLGSASPTAERQWAAFLEKVAAGLPVGTGSALPTPPEPGLGAIAKDWGSRVFTGARGAAYSAGGALGGAVTRIGSGIAHGISSLSNKLPDKAFAKPQVPVNNPTAPTTPAQQQAMADSSRQVGVMQRRGPADAWAAGADAAHNTMREGSFAGSRDFLGAFNSGSPQNAVSNMTATNQRALSSSPLASGTVGAANAVAGAAPMAALSLAGGGAGSVPAGRALLASGRYLGQEARGLAPLALISGGQALYDRHAAGAEPTTPASPPDGPDVVPGNQPQPGAGPQTPQAAQAPPSAPTPEQIAAAPASGKAWQADQKSTQGVNSLFAGAHAGKYPPQSPIPGAEPTGNSTAYQQAQESHAAVQDLFAQAKAGTPPAQLAPAFQESIQKFVTSGAAMRGVDVMRQLAVGTAVASGQPLPPHVIAGLPAVEEAAKNAPPGIDLDGFKQQYWDSLSGTQKMGAGVGLSAALLGIGMSIFGEGGFGSMLMALLGLAGAGGAMGLFGGEGGQGALSGPLGGLGKQLHLDEIPKLLGLNGGGDSAVPAEPPPVPPVAAAPPPAAAPSVPGAPSAGPAAGGAPTPPPVAAVPPADQFQGFMADKKLDPAEGAQIMQSPALRRHLLGLPKAQQQEVVQAMLAGDPKLKDQLAELHGGLHHWTGPIGKNQAYQAAYKQRGLSRAETDALDAAAYPG